MYQHKLHHNKQAYKCRFVMYLEIRFKNCNLSPRRLFVTSPYFLLIFYCYLIFRLFTLADLLQCLFIQCENIFQKLFKTKSWELPQFPCVQVVCNIPLESSWRGLQCCFRPHLNRKFPDKVMGSQSCESPNFGNFGTPTIISQNKDEKKTPLSFPKKRLQVH